MKRRTIEKCRVNPLPFISVSEPIYAYLLGLIWADGHVRLSKNTGSVTLTSTNPDADEILSILNFTGDWCHTKSQPKQKTWKIRNNFYTQNYYLASFLFDNDYKIKSFESADKILNKIPENLKHHWFRGLSDGDGCFMVNKKHGQYNFSVVSGLNQNWRYLEDLCNKLNIKYKIVKEESNNGNCSRFFITGGKNVIKFGEFIYKDEKFGLTRKYKKFLELKKTFKPKSSKFKGVCFDKNTQKWRAFGSQKIGVKKRSLGVFSTELEAANAVDNYYKSTI